MTRQNISAGARVVVSNLRKLADANQHSLQETPPNLAAPPMIFARQYVANRRMNATGTVERPHPGHFGFGIWIVLHDDGERAVYHESELLVPARAAVHNPDRRRSVAADHHEQTSRSGALLRPVAVKPIESSIVRGMTIEVYKGVDATALGADLLIVVLPPGSNYAQLIANPLHRAIRARGGDYYHAQLDGAGALACLQTVLAEAPTDETRPPFGDVLFINGGQPTPDAMDKALQAAADHGSESVIMPVSDFVVFDEARAEIDVHSLIECIDMITGGRDITFKTIKLVI